MGSDNQYIRMNFRDNNGKRFNAAFFGDADSFDKYIAQANGDSTLNALYKKEAEIDLDVIYSPSFNYWNGQRSISCSVKDYRIRGQQDVG